MDNTVDNPIDNSSLAISQQELLQLDSAALLLGLPPSPQSPAAVTGEAAVITMCLYLYTGDVCGERYLGVKLGLHPHHLHNWQLEECGLDPVGELLTVVIEADTPEQVHHIADYIIE